MKSTSHCRITATAIVAHLAAVDVRLMCQRNAEVHKRVWCHYHHNHHHRLDIGTGITEPS